LAGFVFLTLLGHYAIYAIEVDQPWVALLASKHKFLKAWFLAYILNISEIFGY